MSWPLAQGDSPNLNGVQVMSAFSLARRLAKKPLIPPLVPTAAILLLLTGCYMLEPRVKVGRLAPRLTIDKWYQAPPDAHAEWLNLRGKVVVLNFWEPWDQGSINALSHLNDLARRYAPLPNVQFIHVSSSGSTETLSKFTSIIPIRGWIAMDPDRTVFTAYGVHEYPDTWLINGEGRVIAITKPRFVTEQVIDAIIAGRTEVPIDEGFIN
jgi:hypothetical protein